MTSFDGATPSFSEESGRLVRPGVMPPEPAGDAAGPPRPAEPDAICASAVNLAVGAARELAGPDDVGDHLGVLAEGERLVTHYFRCLVRGYNGWRWAVTVARAPRSRTATICETALLPGDGAVLAPAWVPWSDRLTPGDLGATDVLPYREDDPLLEPGYTRTDDGEADRVALWELGLGRARVLGRAGRDEVASRWYHGERGPTAAEAVHAAAACSTCGYFIPLAGSLRQAFGVCANEWSPSDARVVSVDHGCGAHSETDLERPEPLPLPEPILDETGAEAITLPPRIVQGPDAQDAGAQDPDAQGPDVQDAGAQDPDALDAGAQGPDVQDAGAQDPDALDVDAGPQDPGAQDPGAQDAGAQDAPESRDAGDTGSLVGDGIAPVPLTPVPLGEGLDVGPAAGREPRLGESRDESEQ